MNRMFLAAVLSVMTFSLSAQKNVINDMLVDMGKETMVIIRQDYQLIDGDDNVKNSEGKEYWKRTYALALRVGDDKYMISDETVRPWSKHALSKKDKFQPVVSYTACRPIEAIEFDEIDYNADNLTEIQENRIFTFDGSEIPGASVVAPAGILDTYILYAESSTPISEENESVKLKIGVGSTTFSFLENKSIYDLNIQLPDNTFGGFVVVPLALRPGLVDFCVVGMLQKVGGIWKVVSIADGTIMSWSDMPSGYNLNSLVNGLMNDIESDMNSVLDTIGISSQS